MGIVRWWATWPAEQVQGALVSDNTPRRNACQLVERLRKGRGPASEAAQPILDPTLSYPPELIARLAKLDEQALADPNLRWEGDDAAEARRVLAMLPIFRDLEDDQCAALVDDPGFLKLALNVSEEDRFAVRAAAEIVARHDPELLAVYLQGVDALGHRIEFHAKRDPRFLAVIDRYWECVDASIGELRDAVAADATWVVVSDHGWSYAAARYGHYHAPDGIFLLSGPGARAGQVVEDGGPHVLDVAPTVLALLGLPPSTEMPGAPVVAALAPEWAPDASARIDSYGVHRPVWADASAGGAGGTRAEMLETLQELGYVE